MKRFFSLITVFFVFVQSALLAQTSPPVITGSSTNFCPLISTTPVTLTATGCAGSIRWSIGTTGSVITVSVGGTYAASCITNNGTSTSLPYHIESGSSGVLSQVGNSCANSSVVLQTSLPLNTYPEYSRDGNFLPHINSYTYKALDAGNYTFTAVQKDITISGNQATNSTLKINDVFFINANKGWAVGRGTFILSTTNGGQTWNKTSIGLDVELKDVFFVNELTGWAAGYGSKLYKTTDGGASWALQTVNEIFSYDIINAVFFTDINNGFVAVSNRWYYRTTNGGASWTLAGGGGNTEMVDLFFANQYNGWVLTDGSIRRTTDGGWSWESIFIQNLIALHTSDIFFINAYEGWIVGDNGYITHTTDGGQTWQPQQSNTNLKLNRIVFTNAKEGWIVGEKGLLLYTNDGGNFWIRKNLGSDKNFTGLFFTDAKTGWVSGEEGVIKKITANLIRYCPSNAIVLKPSPAAPQVSKAACNATQVVLTATGCTGVVSWSNGATGSAVTVNSSGTYTAACVVNGCRSIDSKPETVNIGPSGTLIADNGNTCLNASPRLSMTGLGSNYGFEWRKDGVPFDNGNRTDFNPTATGTYEVVPYLKGEKFWEWQAPDVPNFAVFATSMSAPNKAWAVGEKGYIMYSEDGGTNWKYILIDATLSFDDIQFVNEQTGFVVGSKDHDHYIIKTTDGGKHWQKIFLNNSINSLLKIFFLDENTGWAVGTSRTIMKTTNGGLNWFAQSHDPYSQEHLLSVFFVNSNHGWATGSLGVILNTTDGGNSWHNQTSPDVFSGFFDVVFLNQQKGIIVGEDGAIVRTNDGGNTWKLDSAARSNFRQDYNRIVFINETTGWIFGTGCVLNTIDGGTTWGISRVAMNSSYKLGGDFYDAQHGMMGGSGGTIIVTHNGGHSWNAIYPPVVEAYKEVYFSDAYNGRVLGDVNIGTTNNGGRTWTFTQPVPLINDLLIDIHYLNNKVWLITSKKIYYSSDGGLNWTEQYTQPNSKTFSSVFFKDQNNGWVTGSRELLLKTTNGGTTWAVVPLPTDNVVLTDIHFMQNKGWLIGEQGRMYYSDDSGATWTLQENMTESYMADVFFLNANVGWIGTGNELFRTTNDGVSWQRISYYSFPFSKIHFATPAKGWALLGGKLATSYDGGISWAIEAQSPGFNASIFALNEEAVMIVGGGYNGIQKFYNAPTFYCPTNSIVMSNPNPPTLSSFTTVLCANKTLTLTASNCSGTVTWSNGQTGSVITVNAAGTYRATCTTNSCASNASNAIQITQSANCYAITIAPGNVYACPNKPITLTANGCPGNNVVWSNNMSGNTIQVSLATATTIEAFCRNGGSQTVSISVAVDDLNLTTNLQGGEHFYQVNKSIQSSSRINTNGTSPAKVDYVSGKSILLKPGFEASQQNLFKAEIRTCQN
ncbi:YCF48-related protein [Emticicia agri]|uniref:Photosynthesis system II assembly factor Ycf48/Hcf136-like domain-containing protein n=1 Tax=Emticicia agri TaxID=2492393 RepID=A0A4Q5LVK8_9BACT|nr:YCF48-related protein [Emticicia agri]RYU93589.1 hypothetical protein EWM59_21315 [Emticicia agri]